MSFFGDVIKACPDAVHLFPGSFGRHGKDEVGPGFENIGNLVHHILVAASVNRYAARPPEEPAQRAAEQLFLSQKVGFTNGYHGPDSHTDYNIPRTGMWTNDDDALPDFVGERSLHFPANQFPV